MSKPTDNLFDGLPDDDQDFWRLLLSIPQQNHAIAPIEGALFTSNAPDLDNYLRSLQQAILAVDRDNGSLQKQVEVLIRYWKVHKRRLDTQDEAITALHQRISKLEKKKKT